MDRESHNNKEDAIYSKYMKFVDKKQTNVNPVFFKQTNTE